MTHRPWQHKTATWTVLLMIALAAVGAVVVSLVDTSEGGSDTISADDLLAIETTIEGYRKAFNAAVVVAPGALTEVEANQDAITPDLGQAAEGQSHPAILPVDLRAQMEAAWAEAKARYCTPRFASSLESWDLVGTLDLGLYNNPDQPVVVGQPCKVIHVKYMTGDAGRAIVWGLHWTGDVYTRGNGTESWTLHEYELVAEAGTWLIESDHPILQSDDESVDDWGPTSPHQALVDSQITGTSIVYPDGIPSTVLEGVGSK